VASSVMLQENSDMYYYIHKLSKYSTQPQVVIPPNSFQH